MGGLEGWNGLDWLDWKGGCRSKGCVVDHVRRNDVFPTLIHVGDRKKGRGELFDN